jgi:hypothetical protein
VLEVNVASVNVNVYVLGFSLGGSNVAAVHVHVCVLGVNIVSEHVDVYVIRGSILPLFISMCMCMC